MDIMHPSHIAIAFLLTILAGLSTSIGGLLAFTAKKIDKKLLSLFLGFSAGVMIYISFVDIFQKSKDALIPELGKNLGYILTTSSFFGGVLIIALIDKLVPKYENPHEMHNSDEMAKTCKHLYRMGIFSAIAIAIHNFPEGLATFVAALNNTSIGISIAVAIAIHNIPEGIAVSVPLYCSTGSKRKAFLYSSLSGLAEPLGALIGFAILYSFFNNITFGIIFGIVAGIMVYIALDELLPAAQKYGEHHLSIYGLIAGMMVMAISLILFGVK
jgi:ZIP family zinc transporter